MISAQRARRACTARRVVVHAALASALAVAGCSGEPTGGSSQAAGAAASAALAGSAAGFGAPASGGAGGMPLAGTGAVTGGGVGGGGGAGNVASSGSGGSPATGGSGDSPATGGTGGASAGILDGGALDAAVADAGFDAGASNGDGRSCAGASYLICEDFEDAPVGGTPDGWSKHGDASAVTDAEAHAGARALELGAISVWERRIYHDASALGSAHWGRIYFKVKLPVPDAFVHSTLVALSGVGPTRGASEYRVVDTVKQAVDTPNVASRIQFLWNVQPQSSGEFGEGTSYDREFDDAWHCAEWHVDASDQSYAFYLDGAELLSFAKGVGNYDGSDIPDSFQELRVGWINYQDAPPGFTAWIDDVAVDDTRIGCL